MDQWRLTDVCSTDEKSANMITLASLIFVASYEFMRYERLR